MSPKRVLLAPVYLTTGERDLVRQAVNVLAESLAPPTDNTETTKLATKWAKSYTRKRLLEVCALFEDKPEAAA